MLKHCVFVSFQSTFTQGERNAMLAKFETICELIPGAVDFSFGPNLDFENKSENYSDGFIITFSDRAALQAYDQHPMHIASGAKMVKMCNNGANGIIVFDLDV